MSCKYVCYVRKKHRPGLDAALEAVSYGDIFVVESPDRLVRSVEVGHYIEAALEEVGCVRTVFVDEENPDSALSKFYKDLRKLLSDADQKREPEKIP
jgi:hypothetical protein